MGRAQHHPTNSHLVDVRLLSKALQKAVRAELFDQIGDPERRMTYLEASRFYGVPYESIKTYVYQGRIVCEGLKHKRRITHGEMRRFLLTYDPKSNGRTLPILKRP